MARVSGSRFAKWLEAVSQFSNEILIEPDEEWLTIRAIDGTHVIMVSTKLKLWEPIYDKFAINVRHVLRFMKHIHGEIQLKLEDRKLVIEGNGFLLKVETIDPNSLKLISEPSLEFDLSTDIEIDLLVNILKRLKRVDIVTFIANRDGLRIEAKTETSRYSRWLGTPSFLKTPEVRVSFLTQFLSPIIHALSILSRPPNATFTTVELRTNYPGRFTLKDDDLVFRAYIAPRIDD